MYTSVQQRTLIINKASLMPKQVHKAVAFYMRNITFNKHGFNYVVSTTLNINGQLFTLINTECGWNTNTIYQGQRWFCPQVPHYCSLNVDESTFKVREGFVQNLYKGIFINVFMESKRFQNWQSYIDSAEFELVDGEDVYRTLTKGSFDKCLNTLVKLRKHQPGVQVRFLV